MNTLYRLPQWHLGTADTVIIRTDCNVPLKNGIILDDARLRATLPTIQMLQKIGCRIIILTHWGRPKNHDRNLSTQHLIPWFLEHGISAQFIPSSHALMMQRAETIALVENIRFFDPSEAQRWIDTLGSIGTHFIHDGFSVMHRDDLFNTELPRRFPVSRRSLGINAYNELRILDTFLAHWQKPALGIFGGAKLSSKIDAIEALAKHRCPSIALLPAIVNSFFLKMNFKIGRSFIDETTEARINLFEQQLKKSNCVLLLPTDVMVSINNGAPPYTAVSADAIQEEQSIVSIGPRTITTLSAEIKGAQTIIINGVSGFTEYPPSLEPFKELLQAIITADRTSHTLIAGGDTCAALKLCGVADLFPHQSLAGGATVAYCAGQLLPGLQSLSDSLPSPFSV